MIELMLSDLNGFLRTKGVKQEKNNFRLAQN